MPSGLSGLCVRSSGLSIIMEQIIDIKSALNGLKGNFILYLCSMWMSAYCCYYYCLFLCFLFVFIYFLFLFFTH